MIPRIHPLDDLLVAQIAAGEVVESPVGALKELLENALDAQAKNIEIIIRESGFNLIQVRDDGHGIYRDDLPASLQSFSTSKISNLEDLHKVYSLGFRGEALGSIRSVSKITIESKAKDENAAWKITANGKDFSEIEPGVLPVGTLVKIEELFYNIPVRRDFNTNDRKIRKNFVELITSYAICYYSTGFILLIDDKEYLNLPPRIQLIDRIRDIFSSKTVEALLPVFNEFGDIRVSGYISNFRFYHSNASQIFLYINKRWVFYKPLVGLLKNAYGELMPPGRFPTAILFIDIPAEFIDVNIHPQKKEIRFRNESEFTEQLRQTILRSIEGRGRISMTHLHKDIPESKTVSEPENKFQVSESSGSSEKFDFFPQFNLQDIAVSKKESATGFPQKIHGQLFDTFFLASSEEGIYLVDQHTAHERINYEKFLKTLDLRGNTSQKLLEGIPVHFLPAELSILSNCANLLQQLGFYFEQNGPNDFLITEVPFYVQDGNEVTALRTSISLLEKNGKLAAIDLFDALAKDLSCSASVKKGESLSYANGQSLIEQLAMCEHPARCPHGRPTMIFLGKQEIFDMFKRTGSRGSRHLGS